MFRLIYKELMTEPLTKILLSDKLRLITSREFKSSMCLLDKSSTNRFFREVTIPRRSITYRDLLSEDTLYLTLFQFLYLLSKEKLLLEKSPFLLKEEEETKGRESLILLILMSPLICRVPIQDPTIMEIIIVDNPRVPNIHLLLYLNMMNKEKCRIMEP